MTDLSLVISQLVARIGRDITEYIVVPFLQLKIGDFYVNVLEEFTNMNDIWHSLMTQKTIKAGGVAVLNYKLNFTYGNRMTRCMDLMCDVLPAAYIQICDSFLYDSNVFTREKPLNMMSQSVIFGDAKIHPIISQNPPIEYKATVVFLTDKLRNYLSKMFYPQYGCFDCGAAFSNEKAAHIFSNM